MAGKFYSQEEIIKKFGTTQDEIKRLVKDGKLREFRTGKELSYGVEEVDAFFAGASGLDVGSEGSVELVLDETAEVDIEPDETAKPGASDAINLGELTGGDINLGELTSADTSIGTSGINVLSETEDEYKLADSKAETRLPESTEELSSLDDDINLDSSVGSGSGLLDLSLQADDTSLGAVLDDILPAAGGEGEAQAGGIVAEDVDVAEEADKMFEGAEPEVPVAAAASPMVTRYVEPEPDAVSNACGIALFVPLIATVLATIVILAALRGVSPGLLELLKAPGWYDITMIWYVAIIMALVAIVIIVVGAAVGGRKDKKPKTDVYEQPEQNA